MLPPAVIVLVRQLHEQFVQQPSPLPLLDLLQLHVQVLQSKTFIQFRIVRGVLGGPMGKHVRGVLEGPMRKHVRGILGGPMRKHVRAVLEGPMDIHVRGVIGGPMDKHVRGVHQGFETPF